MVTNTNNRSNGSQPPNNNNNDDSKKTSNPLVKLFSNTVYGAVGGATSVALTALPFVNKYIGVANAGMLPKAIGYGAISGAIVGAVMPFNKLSENKTTDNDVHKDVSIISIGLIIGLSIANAAVRNFITGYLAKELAPNVFKETSVNTGVKLIGSSMTAFGLNIITPLA